MPRYVLLEPLLSVGVRTKLHQVRLLQSVKDFLWICNIEKVNLQRERYNNKFNSYIKNNEILPLNEVI